jgi:superoxide reductase
MNVLEANTSDGAVEKHVPVVSMEGDVCTVKVGSVNHPMSEEHWIEWILIKTEKGIQRKILTPGDAPMAKFALIDDRVLETYAYCNLHGLWKA